MELISSDYMYLQYKRGDVRASAILLDEENPGWEWRVDPNTLKTIHDPCGCILFALYGGYSTGLCALACNMETERNYGRGYGFSCDKHVDADVVGFWKEEILARRKVELPPKPLLAKCVALALAK